MNTSKIKITYTNILYKKDLFNKNAEKLVNYFLSNILKMPESIRYNAASSAAISVALNKYDDCYLYYKKSNGFNDEELMGFITYRDLVFGIETEIMYAAAVNMEILFKLILRFLEFNEKFNTYNIFVCIFNNEELIDLYEKAGFYKDYIRDKRYRQDKPIVVMRKTKWDTSKEDFTIYPKIEL